MFRHVTENFAMLTGENRDSGRRTVDLVLTTDGREAAVLRHHTPSRVTSWHITEDPDPDATDVAVAMFYDLYSDDADVVDWYMPREAAEEFILTFIDAV